jgi:hypothetical protein
VQLRVDVCVPGACVTGGGGTEALGSQVNWKQQAGQRIHDRTGQGPAQWTRPHDNHVPVDQHGQPVFQVPILVATPVAPLSSNLSCR